MPVDLKHLAGEKQIILLSPSEMPVTAEASQPTVDVGEDEEELRKQFPGLDSDS
ncbi:MAG: hypothetical protein KGJ35_00055 [Patescibacteria group bacterium]|nr:hypothetical protein [Patescibacteria group bacterium]